MLRYIYSILFVLTMSALNLNAQHCVGTPGQLQWQCWQNLYDDEFGELYADEFYPATPDVSQTIYKVQSPLNYDNLMGGRIAGFISVPNNGHVQFNVTGDDKVNFYLSSDTTAANLQLEAYMTNWSSVDEHDKYPEQTSDSIYMLAGQYYYFELTYVESYGGDHVNLWWKNSFVSSIDWNIITAAYINDVACLATPCPSRGTPCDDGNSTTLEDTEDGHCNCVGTKISLNPCVGEKTMIKNYKYTGIPGNYLNDLYMDPNFPAMPSTSRNLNILGQGSTNERDSLGNLIQGYIRVPVSGNYSFNVTGNNETIFFISSDDTEANKQSNQILVSGSTSPTEHNKYIYQTSGSIYMNEANYYYVELNHKEGSGSEHFSVFWKTPFTDSTMWKRIPDVYFYDYECTLACISQGTSCDDGDPFTNYDQYDGNCECVGTPCDPSTCNDPIASYIPYPKCEVTDQLDNREDNNWLSCTMNPSPNPMRGLSHWIQYDLGQNHAVFNSHIWNYNHAGFTNQGFQLAAVDISDDGIVWTEYGVYNWNLANGDPDYAGFIGPNFGGIQTRYILITCLDNASPCKGLGKTAFTALVCPLQGTSCDDSDPTTIGDVYNNNCECLGAPIDENQCQQDTLLLGDSLIVSNNYSAVSYVQSESQLDTSTIYSLIAGDEVSLEAGFDAPANSNLSVLIDTCEFNNSRVALNTPMVVNEMLQNETKTLRVINQKANGDHLIQFKLVKGQEIKLDIIDENGLVVYRIIEHHYRDKGIYLKRIRSKKLPVGVYTVRLHSSQLEEKERLIVNR